ncbi:hypothetical protein Ahia01_001396500 [Argonauta hians]
MQIGGFAVFLDTYQHHYRELKAFEPLIKQNALHWETLSHTIYYGGTDLPRNPQIPTFIGCLQDLKYENSDGDYILVPVEDYQNVTWGCLDLCAEVTDTCQHNSSCINHYDHVTCQCFHTDYEGVRCEKKGVTHITLRGYEWLTYQLYEKQLDAAIQISRISMEFKTQHNTGILLYAVGGSPTYSHIIALLHSGSVNVSISFDGVDHDFSFAVKMERNSDPYCSDPIPYYSDLYCSDPIPYYSDLYYSDLYCSDPYCSDLYCSDPIPYYSDPYCSDPYYSDLYCSDPYYSDLYCSDPIPYYSDLYYSDLYCSDPCYSDPYRSDPYYSDLYCSDPIPYYSDLYYSDLYCSDPYYSDPYYSDLYYSDLYYSDLYCSDPIPYYSAPYYSDPSLYIADGTS